MSYLQSKLSESLFVEGGELEPWQKALMDAAERIRERGWCQGVACDGEGRVCLLGAIFDIRVPTMNIYWPALARGAAEEAANRMIARGTHGNWNDASERTAAEVIHALESCALSRARDTLSRS